MTTDSASPQSIPPLFLVREYGTKSGDWQMVSEWWVAHTSERSLVETFLPPVGIIVERDGEPVAAVWCHLSAGIGVAMLESPVTKPGMSMAESSEAMDTGIRAIEAICRTHNYGLLVANTLPGIATWLERRQGFLRNGERVQLMKRID